ncbi:cysteine dioxygenase [Antrihabitans cavernicola]|uniref:Cysteine dioxygenase n=1 Tax=Antrihabitans cavernicola TaxID=2495913 RepID=A0A5A7S7D0_9NOCA|nr:cysteine dioxygenase family protein [Spelaeibacter cavernicola]KAA0022058.1 cysteine dioxygenase [Spelaeibacter cavernicola]
MLSANSTATPLSSARARRDQRLADRPIASALPTRLRSADLLRLTDQGAEDVLAGKYDHLLPEGGTWPTENRWAVRLSSDDDVDVWLISWVPDQSTELHDHAGSLGALTVLSGALSEFRWTGSELRQRTLEAGDQASFPIGWVHDVMRAPGPYGAVGPDSKPAPSDPTLSVHAYSPPLTAMSYYEVTDHNTIRRTRSQLTDQPEGDLK